MQPCYHCNSSDVQTVQICTCLSHPVSPMGLFIASHRCARPDLALLMSRLHHAIHFHWLTCEAFTSASTPLALPEISRLSSRHQHGQWTSTWRSRLFCRQLRQISPLPPSPHHPSPHPWGAPPSLPPLPLHKEQRQLRHVHRDVHAGSATVLPLQLLPLHRYPLLLSGSGGWCRQLPGYVAG